jgi:molybdopterin-containing oxidoreductase family membrane subunit
VYFFETFYGMISNHEFEHGIIIEKLHGRMRGFYIGMLIMNVLIPQLLWFKKIRQNISATIAISVLIVAGMWIERYVVVITSLIRDYMPSMWQDYLPGKVEIALLAGTIGVFILLFMVFSRFVPVIPKLNVD